MKIKKSHICFSLFWVLCISFVIGSIHSWHLVEFTPKKESFQSSDLNIKTDNYGVIHFLTPMCSCSETILKHLLKRGPLPRNIAKETVVIIDDKNGLYTKKLTKLGFQVSQTSFTQAKKKYSDSITGVPLLVIYDKKKATRYAGGYAKQLITPFTKIDIKSFINKISSGRELASLPVKGCSVSKDYQRILDPLGLKYTKE